MGNLKSTVRETAGAVGRHAVLGKLIRQPFVRRLLKTLPGAHTLYGGGWYGVHPFDRQNGTDTSGFVSVDELPADAPARDQANPYAGSQPGVLRQALGCVPSIDTCTFVDLGCGKGRAVLVASEFSFKDICGVELSADLAGIARKNVAIVSSRHPQRTPVRIVVADAAAFSFPAGNLVLFLYNPFGAELMAQVVHSVEAAMAAENRSVYVIYYNPINGHCFDASPLLRRRFARVLPYASEEIGYGPDDDDPLVIWQGGAAPAPTEVADARIVVLPGAARVRLDGPEILVN